MSRLEFKTEPLENIPNSLLIRLEGNIDATSALDFSQKLDEWIEQGTMHFVFDMERVLFVNSTGMGLLVRAADKTKQAGGAFLLIKIHPKVKIVFQMLGLDQFFETYTSQDKAVEHLEMTAGGTIAAGAPSAGGAQKKQAAAGGASRPAPPPPAAPAPRRAPAGATPPPPAAPTPRGGGRGGAAGQAAASGPMMSTANLPRNQQQAAAAGGQLQAFIAMPGALQHYGIIYSFVQAACVGAQLVAKRMDPNPAAHERNLADLNQAAFVLADFTPVNGQVDPQVLQYAQAARSMNPPKQVICLVQGRKENLPKEWANLPTVPYHASQQGMQYLKQYLEKGLKTLVARRTGQQ